MKNEVDVVDVALSTIIDPPQHPKLTPRMVWVRGLALERQRAARRALRITRLLSAATLLLVVVAVGFVATNSTLTIVTNQMAAAVGAVFILGYTTLQLIRSPR